MSPEAWPALALAAGDDAHLRETPLARESVFQGRLLNVVRDTVRLPDGETATRELIVHPGAVMVIPVLDDGRLVVERQFRHPMGSVVVEFPAGKKDASEASLCCAARELHEETGLRAREWALVGQLAPSVAYTDERIDIWLARGLTQGAHARDEGEFLDVCLSDLAQLESMARDGSVVDSKTLIGLWWLRQWRDGAWQPVWQSVEHESV